VKQASEDVGVVPEPVRRHGIASNVAALTGGQLVTWTMTLLWTFVVPRALGPSGMGLIVSGWAVAGVLGTLLGLGTKNYLVREMVLDGSQTSDLLGTAIVLRLALAPLFALAVVVYLHFAHYSTEGARVVYLASGATLLILLAEPMQAGFQAMERMEYLAYADVISKSAQGVVGIALALLGIGSVGITTCWLLSVGFVLVLNMVWLRPFALIDLHTTGERLVRLVKKSLAYWAFGLFFMVYLWIDSLMLSLMTRSEVVGWYGVPTRLFQTMMFLPVIIATAWLPRLVSAHQEGPDQLREASRAPLQLVLLLGLPLCAGTVVVARPLIDLLYGAAYTHAVPVLMVLGLCIPLMYLNIILGQIVIAANRQSTWTWIMACATVVNPVMNAGLITVTDHRYGNGAIGAAIALVLTEAFIVFVGFLVVGRHLLDGRLAWRVLRTAGASSILCIVGFTARPLGVPVSLAAAVLALALASWPLRVLTSAEVAVARSHLTRIVRRRVA
jgi:O-antigen/teichoic acid export membrane protein